jgi:hypothetical protein
MQGVYVHGDLCARSDSWAALLGRDGDTDLAHARGQTGAAE